MADIKYHTECYKPYVLCAAKYRETETTTTSSINEESGDVDLRTPTRLKHRKSINIGVICEQRNDKNDSNLYHLCEDDQAKKFSDAVRHNLDNIFDRTAVYETKE